MQGFFLNTSISIHTMRANRADVRLNDPCANSDPIGIYEHPPLPESHIPNGLLQAGANPYL